MGKKSKAQLKALFVPGRVLLQQDFYDLIDSVVHLDDQVAVDQQVVNTKIATYDTQLKAQTANGTVDSLGDVYKVFNGYADSRSINDELKWGGLPGKPAQISVTWTEQTIVTDQTTYNPLGSGGSAGSGPYQRWLGSTVGALTGSYVVNDIQTYRRWMGTEAGYYLDMISAIKVAIQPKVVLS